MKKLLVMIVSISILASFAACGCMRSTENETTTPTSDTTIVPTTMPDIIPPIESNIPDPDVNTEMPAYTDGTETSDTTGNTTDAETIK